MLIVNKLPKWQSNKKVYFLEWMGGCEACEVANKSGWRALVNFRRRLRGETRLQPNIAGSSLYLNLDIYKLFDPKKVLSTVMLEKFCGWFIPIFVYIHYGLQNLLIWIINKTQYYSTCYLKIFLIAKQYLGISIKINKI